MSAIQIFRLSEVQEFLQILGASLFIALMTQIQIFLPFNPVPITGQTLAVMCVGAFLGSRKGVLSVLLYLAEGAMGLPFFTKAGFGILHLVGPTGGYMAGFIVQAYLTGLFFERKWNGFAGLILASALQMGLGALWLAPFVGWSQALPLGFYPFIPGECLKALFTWKIKEKS